jgi:cytochrome bd-type quinol oxidase subunit 1
MSAVCVVASVLLVYAAIILVDDQALTAEARRAVALWTLPMGVIGFGLGWIFCEGRGRR